MNGLNPPPVHFWPLLALCLLAFAGLWWFVLGARRLARRRQLRRRIEALGSAAPAPEDTAPAALRQAATQTRLALAQSTAPRMRTPPLYRIPWFMFLGDDASDVGGLLDAAQRTAPEPLARTGAAEAFWRWRQLPSMVAIETRPALLHASADDLQERALWCEALVTLAEQRRRLPLNGIVVCADVASLAAGAQDSGPVARRLIDEAAEALQLHLPVYLVVTGLEQLPGYDALRATLPAEVLAQALGHRLPNVPAQGTSFEGRFDALFDTLTLRLHALRMGLLRDPRTLVQRQGIHAFVEQLFALRPGLGALAACLFDNPRGSRPPRWRGLYFAAAPSEEADGGAFVADLFQHFLPADQPLARS
ncbi:type VI secretion system protein [Variovorax sp. PBL-E5]|uniref:type VI secretion system protein n=1 Tax=Variovorax sp. PBL-E5 TaxID=434014 RepID=UPI0013196BD9|nr:type VI secretion system protein [Variovorax sp. PBL-E5]VTU38859.1 type VI secretion protein IcmF [Variovorax sp. PBL-E5]